MSITEKGRFKMSSTTIKCPVCLAEIDVLEALAEGDLRAVLDMQDAFYPHGRLVRAYFELFGVSPGFRNVHRLRVLTEEMRTLFEREEFSYNRKSYRISRAGIAEALSGMVKRRFPEPLKNHNYLKSCMITISEREASTASKTAERDLRKKETGLRSGARYPVAEETVTVPAPKLKDVPPAHLTPEQIEANRKRLKDMITGIG